MKSAVFKSFLLFLFMELVVPDESNVCIHCIGKNSKTCQQDGEKACKQGSECITISEEYVANDTTCTSISRRCADNLPCNSSMYSFTHSNLMIKLNLQCCKGNRCNSGPYEMPSNPTNPQGRMCPTCVNYGTWEECNATQSTVCWGEDDECHIFKATVIAPDGAKFNISLKGCSSKNACDLDYSQTAGTSMTFVKEYRCYEPIPPAKKEEKQKPTN